MAVTSSASRTSRAAHLGPERRRPLVLDAALVVWSEHGYTGTTMALIAAEAGVSKPVVYACFADKDQVLRALLAREEERLVEAATAALPENVDLDDPAAVVRTAYGAYFRAVLDYPRSWRVVLEARHIDNPLLRQRIERARGAIAGQVAGIVGMHFASRGRELTRRETLLMAHSVIALAETHAALLLQQDPADDDAWSVDDLAEAVTRFVLAGWP